MGPPCVAMHSRDSYTPSDICQVMLLQSFIYCHALEYGESTASAQVCPYSSWVVDESLCSASFVSTTQARPFQPRAAIFSLSSFGPTLSQYPGCDHDDASNTVGQSTIREHAEPCSPIGSSRLSVEIQACILRSLTFL